MTDPRSLALPAQEESTLLAQQWRTLARAATFVAILTSPAAFVWFHKHQGWSIGWSILATITTVAAFRGLIDLVLRRFIPWPSLFGSDDAQLKEEDVVNRRRAWFWRFWYRLVWLGVIVVTLVYFVKVLKHGTDDTSWLGTAKSMLGSAFDAIGTGSLWMQLLFFGFLFIGNFMIFMGPLVLMGISQIRGFEPGDAEWGVKLDDVRGQKEAKEEIRRVVSLWQSGEHFEAAGGKRERGVLFLGAPGTGKTMLAKAIATGFNSPFVTIPGSGFAQTFIGIDVLIVRFLARKAKKLAAKWGGHGMKRRRTRSIRPRKAATVVIVARIDQPMLQPWCLWNQTNAAGLVQGRQRCGPRESPPLLRQQSRLFLIRKRAGARIRHG